MQFMNDMATKIDFAWLGSSQWSVADHLLWFVAVLIAHFLALWVHEMGHYWCARTMGYPAKLHVLRWAWDRDFRKAKGRLIYLTLLSVDVPDEDRISAKDMRKMAAAGPGLEMLFLVLIGVPAVVWIAMLDKGEAIARLPSMLIGLFVFGIAYRLVATAVFNLIPLKKLQNDGYWIFCHKG